MEKLKDDNTFLMHGWIPKKLKLKGNELIIYSIIYSFSIKSSQGYFNGSTAYLQEWTNTSQRNVINCLKSLIKKNLIICIEDNSQIRKPNIYKANFDVLSNIFSTEKSSVVNSTTTEKNSVALLKKVQQTTEKSSVNNNIYKNKYKNSSSISTTTLKNNNKLEDVCNMYKREISNNLPCSPLELDSLKKLVAKYGADKVKEAIKIAVERNKKSLGYIKGVLNNKKAAGNNQPQEVQPPAYKKWQGDEEDEPKPILTEAEKAEREKQIKEAHERLKSLSNIIS